MLAITIGLSIELDAGLNEISRSPELAGPLIIAVCAVAVVVTVQWSLARSGRQLTRPWDLGRAGKLSSALLAPHAVQGGILTASAIAAIVR